MKRFFAALALASLHAGEARAQSRPARSLAYLFSPGVEDARALWVNPAGLGTGAGASLMGEFAWERPAVGAWGLRQYSLGLSSRGIGVGYQRDRSVITGSVGTWRLGSGFNLGRGSLGMTVAFHHPDRGYDIGVRYAAAPSLQLAAVIRDIGRPMAGDSMPLPVSGIAGAQWRAPGGTLRVSAEALAVERQPASGYQVTYRAGAQITARGRTPIAALAAWDLSSVLAVQRWTIGVVIGQYYQAALVGGAVPATATEPRLWSVSATGVATERLRVR